MEIYGDVEVESLCNWRTDQNDKGVDLQIVTHKLLFQVRHIKLLNHNTY